MNFLHNSAIVGALRASALAPPGSPPRRTSASQSCALTRACSTVSSPVRPRGGLAGWPEFGRYWSMNTRRPVGVILHRKPGTTVSRSSTSLVWGWAASTAVLVSLIFAMMTPWNDPDSKSQIGAARGKTGSSFRKHRHMMDARKLLINLLYRATAQSSELPGRSDEHTSEFQSLMRRSYAVSCLSTKKKHASNSQI